MKDTALGNVESLSSAVQAYKDPDSEAFAAYGSFDEAFREIGRLAEKERLVFVIDEYPYLARADRTISSRLQHWIDHNWGHGRMFLTLCSSSVRFMENEVLSYESPLYGRRTGQIHLMPLDYFETARFNPSLSAETKAEIYGITGGVPMYIRKLDVRENLDEALLNHLFHPDGYLLRSLKICLNRNCGNRLPTML